MGTASRDAFFRYVDDHKDLYISRLAEAVAIPSVSADPKRRDDCVRMVAKYRELMDSLGVQSELRELGTHTVNGAELPLPPVIVGRYGSDASKRTVCAYSHLDVQPAAKADGWNTEPFELTRVEQSAADDEALGYGAFPSGGKLFGRGATDDKGPALAWLWAIEAYQELGLEFPVNLLFLIECMEESGSLGLEQVVVREFGAGGYLEAAEAICVSDNYWLGTKKPCVQYGLRGIVYFFAEVSGPAADLHSGKFGGVVHEPLLDLVHVLASLADPQGHIRVPGVMELVAPLTEAERRLYEAIDFDLPSLQRVAAAPRLLHPESAESALMHMWRYPSLTVHGIEGAHAAAGAKTVIPSRVTGKFSIRLVPDMEPAQVEALVKGHCEKAFAAHGSCNTLRVWTEHGGMAFGGDPFDENYQAAARANRAVYGVEPDMVRSGGSIPVTLTMQETGRSVVLFPVGRADDGAHSQNEKIDCNQLLAGVKLLGTYLEEFSRAPGRTAAPTPAVEVCQAVGEPPRKRPAWARRRWGMCGNMAEGQCACCF